MYEEINTFQIKYIEERRDCAIIGPSALASATLEEFAPDGLDPHIEYASLEHFKSMARKNLARSFEDGGEANPAYDEQGELFSGHLQERYPLPRKQGAEPQYKLRSLLTPQERRWNVLKLRKDANARLAHADALEAEGESLAA